MDSEQFSNIYVLDSHNESDSEGLGCLTTTTWLIQGVVLEMCVFREVCVTVNVCAFVNTPEHRA